MLICSWDWSMWSQKIKLSGFWVNEEASYRPYINLSTSSQFIFISCSVFEHIQSRDCQWSCSYNQLVKAKPDLAMYVPLEGIRCSRMIYSIEVCKETNTVLPERVVDGYRGCFEPFDKCFVVLPLTKPPVVSNLLVSLRHGLKRTHGCRSPGCNRTVWLNIGWWCKGKNLLGRNYNWLCPSHWCMLPTTWFWPLLCGLSLSVASDVQMMDLHDPLL